MSLLVQTLGTVSVLLTLVGSYQFSSLFFKSSDIFPGLIAVATTLVFLIAFEYIIFLLGVLTIFAPLVLVSKRMGFEPPNMLSNSLRQKANMKGDDSGLPRSGGELDYAYSCPQCSESYRREPNYCGSCGYEIGDDAS